ncbi:hypothetical protein ACF3NG_07175 [Aerococcaceae bacterium WGS1372]
MFRRRINKDYDEYTDYNGSQKDHHENEPLNSTDQFVNDSDYFEDQYNEYKKFDEYDNNLYRDKFSTTLNEVNSYDNEWGIESNESNYDNTIDDLDTSITESSLIRQEVPFDAPSEVRGQRSRYNARIDRFLNNGIIIVGVLLIIVLVIAFML